MADSTPDRKLRRAEGQQALDGLAEDLAELSGVDRRQMFGSEGLRTGGKVFAFVGTDGELIIKVPARRADDLVNAGLAERVRIGRNPAREWIGVPANDDHDLWRTLLIESHRYVAGQLG